MVVGVCNIVIILADGHSLKEKRRVVKGLLAKVRNKFNVSAAEVGAHDLWQRADIAVSAVGTDKAFVNSVLDHVMAFIEGQYVGDISDFNIELISL